MYIRCSGCWAPSWIEPERQVAPSWAGCECCGRSWDLRLLAEIGATPAERFALVRDLARSNCIDMPSAHSVLLGIMTLEQALGVREGLAQPPVAGPAGSGAAGAGGVHGLPPATRHARSGNRGGRAERGRKSVAAELGQRHGMSPALAARVADGEISLHTALLLKAVRRPEPPDAWTPATRALAIALAGCAALAALLAGLLLATR